MYNEDTKSQIVASTADEIQELKVLVGTAANAGYYSLSTDYVLCFIYCKPITEVTLPGFRAEEV